LDGGKAGKGKAEKQEHIGGYMRHVWDGCRQNLIQQLPCAL
jgi:hypothetical protein